MYSSLCLFFYLVKLDGVLGYVSFMHLRCLCFCLCGDMVGCSVFSCVGPTSDLWVHCRHKHVRFCHSKKVTFIFVHRVVKLVLFIAFFYILHGLEVFEAFCDFA